MREKDSWDVYKGVDCLSWPLLVWAFELLKIVIGNDLVQLNKINFKHNMLKYNMGGCLRWYLQTKMSNAILHCTQVCMP